VIKKKKKHWRQQPRSEAVQSPLRFVVTVYCLQGYLAHKKQAIQSLRCYKVELPHSSGLSSLTVQGVGFRTGPSHSSGVRGRGLARSQFRGWGSGVSSGIVQGVGCRV